MIQIVFNEISAAELSQLPTQIQFQLLEALNITKADLTEGGLAKRFGVLDRKGEKLYRCRAGDYRIYFAADDQTVRIQRVVHSHSLKDFLFRTNLPGGEDEQLAKSKHFWQLIDEGARTLKA